MSGDVRSSTFLTGERFAENDVTGRLIKQQNGSDWERFEIEKPCEEMLAVMKVQDNQADNQKTGKGREWELGRSLCVRPEGAGDTGISGGGVSVSGSNGSTEGASSRLLALALGVELE